MSLVIDDLICPECNDGNLENCQKGRIMVDEVTGLKIRVICAKYAQKLPLFDEMETKLYEK